MFGLANADDIGVSPPHVEVNFKPNLKQTINFRFLGDIGTEYEIYVEGDLQQYIALSKEKIYGPDSVDVFLELPEKIDIPGRYKMKIGIKRVVPENFAGIMIIGDVKANLIVHVPYPGKYLEAEFSADDTRYGEFVDLRLKVMSKGEEDLTMSSKIIIYDSKDNIIEEINLGEHFIKSQETKEFNEKFDSIGHRAGQYKAVAIIDYDNKKLEKEDLFKIGELVVNILGHSDGFVRGIINRFDIDIESQWNDPIENVYGEILIPNYNIRFKTPSETLPGFGRMNLTGYFDPTPIDKDVFFGSITVYYRDKQIRKLVNFKMKKKISLMTYLVIIGILLVIILMIILLILSLWKNKVEKDLKKRKKKR
jgi:hypothetical protein